VNAAIPDEHIFVTAVRFEGEDIMEADLVISATHNATAKALSFSTIGRVN